MNGLDITKRRVGTVRGRCELRPASVLLQAAGVAALLLAAVHDARAESFGRWFFTTEERRILDDLRDSGEVQKQVKRTPGPKAAAPVVDVISFDGKVERSSGGSTVWVNGRPVYTGNTTSEGIRVQPSHGTDGEARFVLPPSDVGTTNFSLRAGQKVAVQNGRKFDAYEVRPDEDAESVLGATEPSEAEPGLDAERSADEDDVPAERAPAPGS